MPKKAAVEENVGDLLLLDATEALHGPLGGGDHQGIQATAEQPLDLLALQVRIALRGRDQQAVILAAQHIGEPAGHFGEERVHQVGNNQPGRIGAPGNERAGGHVRLVVQLLDELENALARLFSNVTRVIADDLGNGYHGHARVRGRCPSSSLPLLRTSVWQRMVSAEHVQAGGDV
jgi:hypothetical protein